MAASDSSPFDIQVLEATSLSQLVANMSPGEVADFSTNNWTIDLISTGTETSLAYSNKGYWDGFDRKAYHFGSGHSPNRGVHIRYDDASNSFEDFTPPGIPPVQGPKHSYEHIAFQPRAGQKGVLYYRNYYSYKVERLDLQTQKWDRIDDIPGSVKQVAGALEWFPELYNGAGGLVFVDGDWGVRIWNSDTGKWESLGDVNPMGAYHNFATYLPDQKVVLFGGGNGSTDVFQIDAGHQITKRANSPHKIGVDRKGILLAQPRKRPVLFSFDNKIWEHDYVADRWIAKGTHEIYTGARGNWVAGISVPDYSCALFLIENTPPRVKVYKFLDA